MGHRLNTGWAGRVLAGAVLTLLAAAPAAAPQARADLPFADAQEYTLTDRPEVRLLWLPASSAAGDARPVIVALHGCGGLYTAKGPLDGRYVDYARRWLAQGWHVLLVDSFTGRGKREICREASATRTIRDAMRRDDVNAALGWLAARRDVDPHRVALMGWSMGASTILRTVDMPAWPLAPRAAVVMYPGCSGFLKKPDYAPAVPLLMMVGADDDWTPPQPCAALARRLQATAGAQPLQFVSYEGSYHGFDRRAAVHYVEGVPNGVDGKGVHMGGNPVARADALPRIQAFLVQHLSP